MLQIKPRGVPAATISPKAGISPGRIRALEDLFIPESGDFTTSPLS